MTEFMDHWDDAMPTIPKTTVGRAAAKHVEKGSKMAKPGASALAQAMLDLNADCTEALTEAARYEEAKAKGDADMVNLPAHYARFKIEPIRFICENNLNWFQGNVIKYLLRYDAKNGMEDVNKAIRYATMFKKYLEGDPDWWKVVT